MKAIGIVLRGMSFQDFVNLAERAERDRCANERLHAIEQIEADKKARAAAFEFEELKKLDRPEYRFLKNAQLKEKKYQAGRTWSNTQARKRGE